MGTLQTTIKLNDQFSNQLAKINRTMQSTARAMASLQKAQLSSAQLLRYEELKTAQAKEKSLQATIRQQTQEARRLEKAQQITSELNKQKMSHQGIFDQMQLWASRLRNIMTMYFGIRTAVEGINRAVKLSDRMTMNDAKFNLVAGGNKKLAGDLKEKTFAAAQRSTTDYLEFGKAVGKLGILAGDKFKNQDSIVRFVELMNKSFQISGADTSERNAAMLQITQAIASNRLQGDEFRSILENAPMVMQSLTKSLGVGHDKLKAMAKEGKITADVLIKAMFDASGKIEEMYKQLPMTWERHWAKIKNVGVLAFEPIHQQLEKLFKSEKFIAFVNGLCTAMIVLGNLGGQALEWLAIGVNKLIDGFLWLKNSMNPVAIILRSLILATITYFAVTKTIALATIVWEALKNAIKAAQAAQWGFNVIASLNPVGLICAGVVLLIALIYGAVQAFNHFAGTSISVIGAIVGAVLFLASLIWDAIIVVLSGILDYLDFWANTWIRIAEVIYNTFANGFTGWINGVKSVFGEFVSWVINQIKPLVQLWDKMKGTNYTATLTATQEKFSNLGGSTYKKFKRVDMGGALRNKALVNPVDAYNYGYKKASSFTNNISKGLGDLGGKFDDLTKAELNGQKLNAEALNGMNDKLGDVGTNTGNTANNTGDIAKNTASTKDYSYLRDWYWNKGLGNSIGYNIKIEQNNRNNVASGMDVDKIANALIDKFMEGLNVGKEGAKI